MVSKRVRIKDRRLSPRFCVSLEVTVVRSGGAVLGTHAGPFQARCLDISRTGLRFFTKELFARTEHIDVTVFNGEGQTSLHVIVEVVRVTKVTGGYEVGGRFLEILPQP